MRMHGDIAQATGTWPCLKATNLRVILPVGCSRLLWDVMDSAAPRGFKGRLCAVLSPLQCASDAAAVPRNLTKGAGRIEVCTAEQPIYLHASGLYSRVRNGPSEKTFFLYECIT